MSACVCVFGGNETTRETTLEMLTKAIVASFITVTILSITLLLLAWLGNPTKHHPSPGPPPAPSTSPLDCVPDRLITGEGLAMAHCFALDESECRVTGGCALVPRGTELEL